MNLIAATDNPPGTHSGGILLTEASLCHACLDGMERPPRLAIPQGDILTLAPKGAGANDS